jgi:O-antigen/teichoic acid export membrane protein
LQFIDARLYGAWLATGSIVAILGLSDFGMFSVITQRVAVAFGKKDFVNLGRLINTSIIIAFILSLIPLVLGLILMQYIPGWLNVEAENVIQISKAFLISSLSTSFMMVSYGSGSIFVALQKTKLLSVIEIILGIISIFATIIFLNKGFGLLSIPLAMLLKSVILSISNYVLLMIWKKKNLISKNTYFDLLFFKDLFSQSLWVFIVKISRVLTSQSDKLILATMLDPISTTILVFSNKSSEILNSLVVQISSSIMPSLAHATGAGEEKILLKYITLTIKATIVIGLYISGGVLLYNKQFVHLWVGEEFFAGSFFTSLIVVYGFVYMINNSFYSILFARGEIKKTSKAFLYESIIKVPTSILFCYLFNINGVIIASIFATITTSFLIQLNSILNLLKLSWIKGFQFFFNKIIMGIVPIGLCWILLKYWNPTTIVNALILGMIYTITFLSVLYFFDKDTKKLIFKLNPLKYISV